MRSYSVHRCAHLARGAPRDDVGRRRRFRPRTAAGRTPPRRLRSTRQRVYWGVAARRFPGFEGAGLRHGPVGSGLRLTIRYARISETCNQCRGTRGKSYV